MQVYVYNIYQIINYPRGEVKSLRLIYEQRAWGITQKNCYSKGVYTPTERSNDMTIHEKSEINRMRLEGYSASAIATFLGLSASTVRSHIHRHPEIENTRLCKNCGKPVLQTPNRREKKFCSDTCRMEWWNKHQGEVHRKAYYTLTCEYCKKEFTSYGNKNRKYCSRDCYTQARHSG